MINSEIELLTNNVIMPFQDIPLDFVELNKLFATRSLAEHGLGFLINIYEISDRANEWGGKLLKSIIFDIGSVNNTFMHNMDIRAHDPNDIDEILLSHWHYDHSGGLYPLIERINKDISVVCHEDARQERFFKRSKDVKNSDLEGKKREEILHLLSSSKIVNQEPIDLNRVESMRARVIFSKGAYEVFNEDGLKITLSGEIPRTHEEEDFSDFYFLQGDRIQKDAILDDKCLIFEYSEHVIVLLGCCHSGIMNTLDHVKTMSKKRITCLIGGFHMAGASEQRINKTLEYLKTFQDNDEDLYLFPIHCTGERFLSLLQNEKNQKWKAFNASVGTVFTF